MPTIHIGAMETDIASIVLMSGDPLRAKYIAEKYLTDYKLVSDIRGILIYTGYYKNKRISIMGHGMGMPSIGIYVYELFKYYHVDTIIRMGSCGSNNKNIHIGDIILANKVNTISNYAIQFINEDIHELDGYPSLNFIIESTAKKNNLKLISSEVTTSDVFDKYAEHLKDLYDGKIVEMEAFALFLIAHSLKKECACLLTVADEGYSNNAISSEEREKNLNDMIIIALESSLQL